MPDANFSDRKLLLLSNSTNAGEDWLEFAEEPINNFLGDSAKTVLFIPYAGVTISFDEYANRTEAKFQSLGYHLESLHRVKDPLDAVKNAEAIVVGGGNTFHLVDHLHTTGIIDLVRKRVSAGIPYIGWSAGSNVACPTMMTTNDMPIVQPSDFGTFNLIPFQINPHYLDANPEGHRGETREQRILEFTEVNRETFVVGLREGTLIHLENGYLRKVGNKSMRVFKYGIDPYELTSDDSLDFLLDTN